MPNLRVAVRKDPSQEPIIWMCSTCEAPFGPPEEETTEEINAAFKAHCAKKHPGETILGLDSKQL
jgi:hypothetical protein